ncbi:MAG: hypothetical protein MJ162_02110 [Treponema sp.]|nr:hypothetical protein [Treponema sp.]
MAIQPIDLQNMYSQMSNVAKNVAGAQQAAAIAESVKQVEITRQNYENSNKVQTTSNDKANTNDVNENGHNQNGQQQNKRRQENSAYQTQNNNNSTEIKAPYLGTIIDLTR